MQPTLEYLARCKHMTIPNGWVARLSWSGCPRSFRACVVSYGACGLKAGLGASRAQAVLAADECAPASLVNSPRVGNGCVNARASKVGSHVCPSVMLCNVNGFSDHIWPHDMWDRVKSGRIHTRANSHAKSCHENRDKVGRVKKRASGRGKVVSGRGKS